MHILRTPATAMLPTCESKPIGDSFLQKQSTELSVLGQGYPACPRQGADLPIVVSHDLLSHRIEVQILVRETVTV